MTNENTVAALTEVAGTPGAMCEIDARRIADGTNIVWHDPTWERVADPASLPPGVDPTDAVADATWAQVSQIRTKGGEPVARLTQMIGAAGDLQVPLLVEVATDLSGPQRLIDLAASVGADVRFYAAPSGDCGTPALDRLRDAGAVAGLKLLETSPCQPSLADLTAADASFVTVVGSAVTPTYSRQLHDRGIELYARWASLDAVDDLIAAGADRVIVGDPTRVVAATS